MSGEPTETIEPALPIADHPAASESPPESESHDDENRLKPEFVRAVLEALDDGDNEAVYELAEPLHPADVADLFELVGHDERRALVKALRDLMGPDVIAELNYHVREELIGELSADLIADIAEQLDIDDAVSMIEDLDEADQKAVLAELDPEDRAAIQAALSFPEETAGRLMSREFVAVPGHMTVGGLIDYLGEAGDLPTEFWEVFIVDPMHKPVGTCMLSWVLRAPRGVMLSDVMMRDQTLIPVTMDQEEVALRFQKYALISAAVIDASGRLVGQLTVDDIVHIIQEEAGEDALAMSGAGDGDINEPLQRTIRGRMWWLFINLITAIAASAVVSAFQATIEKLVVLAVIMPIITGMGGNAATQTMAVTVRALATNQLTGSNTWRMIAREWWIASANGIGLGIMVAIGTLVIYHDPKLALVALAAMILNLLNAGLSGVLIPLGLEKLEIDPAVVSTVFVTTMTDTLGFFFFLGLAALFLT